MFHTSTQKQHWMFKDEDQLRAIREQTNLSFCARQDPGRTLLGVGEEILIFKYYQKKLVELCNLFGPPKWLPLPRTALVRGVWRCVCMCHCCVCVSLCCVCHCAVCACVTAVCVHHCAVCITVLCVHASLYLGNSCHLLQEVLSPHFHHGVSPTGPVVCTHTPPPPLPGRHNHISISSLSCTFLAFKIDEYNITLEQFIETLSPFFPEQQLQHISDFILSHEVCE